MAKLIGKEVMCDGRRYLILHYRAGWELFWAQEVGRGFKTLLDPEECELCAESALFSAESF